MHSGASAHPGAGRMQELPHVTAFALVVPAHLFPPV